MARIVRERADSDLTLIVLLLPSASAVHVCNLIAIIIIVITSAALQLVNSPTLRLSADVFDASLAPMVGLSNNLVSIGKLSLHCGDQLGDGKNKRSGQGT